MSKHKSFRISDFCLRDLPCAVGAYFFLSLYAIGLGLLLEQVPPYLNWLLMGVAGGFLLAYYLLSYLFGPFEKDIDVAALPSPSAKVRAKCDDPASSFVDPVKAYREETGLGLAEAKAVLDDYQNSERNEERTES